MLEVGFCLLSFLGVLSFFLLVVFFDITSRRIPNPLILLGWALAALWHLLAPPGHWAFSPDSPGATGILGFLMGAGSLLLAFMPFYALRIMGAGDVKLMSVVGGFFGATTEHWTQLVGVSLYVLAAGGVLALVRMAFSGKARATLANLRLIVFSLSSRIARLPSPSFDPKTDSADRMPYAVAIALGTLLYVVSTWTGWMTLI